MMELTKKFVFKTTKTNGLILRMLSYAVKNLWNCTLYQYNNYNLYGLDKEPSFTQQEHLMKDNIWYKNLPSQSSQYVIRQIHDSIKAYTILKNKHPEQNPQMPRFKNKNDSTVTFLQWGIKKVGKKIRLTISKDFKNFLFCHFGIKKDFIFIKLKKEVDNIKVVTIKPTKISDQFSVAVTYEFKEKETVKDNKRYISIDIGLKNLFTVYDNKGFSFIVSGSSYRNTCYYYNKKIAFYTSVLDKCKKRTYKKGEEINNSNRINQLFIKRKRCIDYIIHCSTKKIVNYCLENDISKVIIGNLTGIRKKYNHGKILNSQMHSFSFKQLYEALDYKLRKVGIELIKVNEAYSSQCSPISKEVNEKYAKKSNREKRGLYKENKRIYNADAVGAYNIMRIYKNNNKNQFDMPLVGLSNPIKHIISVTENISQKYYQKAVGVLDREYPSIDELIMLIDKHINFINENCLSNSILGV